MRAETEQESEKQRDTETNKQISRCVPCLLFSVLLSHEAIKSRRSDLKNIKPVVCVKARPPGTRGEGQERGQGSWQGRGQGRGAGEGAGDGGRGGGRVGGRGGGRAWARGGAGEGQWEGIGEGLGGANQGKGRGEEGSWENLQNAKCAGGEVQNEDEQRYETQVYLCSPQTHTATYILVHKTVYTYTLHLLWIAVFGETVHKYACTTHTHTITEANPAPPLYPLLGHHRVLTPLDALDQ